MIATAPPLATLLDALRDPARRHAIVAELAKKSARQAAPFSPLLHDAIGLENRTIAMSVVRSLLSVRPEWATASCAARADTPLMAALRHADLDLFDLLVEHGADPRRCSPKSDRNALDVAVELPGNHRIQRAFTQAVLEAAPFTARDKAHALDAAAAELNLGAVRALLARRAPLYVWETRQDRTVCVESALIRACSRHEDEGPLEAIVAEILKKIGRDYLNAGWEHPHGQSAVHAAAESGNTATLSRLIRAGACLNPPAELGLERASTPLMLAARGGEPDAIQALLDAGARVGWVDEGGLNAIHHLASPVDDLPEDFMGPYRLRALKILVAAGEDPLAVDDQGKTPLDLARAHGCQSLASSLLDLQMDHRLPSPPPRSRPARM